MIVELAQLAHVAWSADGGPDFSHIHPNSNGVPKAGVLFTLAQIFLYFGLGICFLVLLGGVIVWVGGHMAGGIHLSERAKSNVLRAMVGGVFLTAAGGIWTWVTTL
ncbi:MAG: hypothetical protein ACRDQ5_27350 [Sciscionella sp.]